QYGKTFAKDPKFADILSDTSIEGKVTITNVHKNINAMAGQLEKSQLDFHKQIKGISGSISSTVKQQEKLVKQIQMRELSSSREVKVVEKSVQQILGKLGYTIDVLGKSSKKILVDTARTTKETLRQYGQALNEDFNINKTNFFAMTLAKATPIFGYFVGKFMETGIFKHFSELIKEKLGMALTFVGNKIKDLWGRGKEQTKNWYSKRKDSKQKQKELPKLQTGGYVTKAGVAKLHAAEVVAPVEKLKFIFIETLQPAIDILKKIYSLLKWKTIFRMAKNVYRWLRRNKYTPFLSKSQDPQIKLVEDVGSLYSQSMDKYDEIIAVLKGKIKGKSKQTELDKAKEIAKSFSEEFSKAFKNELKKPGNMFIKVKEKGMKAKSWAKSVRDIATEERLDFGYGSEFGGQSKSERLKEKFGIKKAKEKAQDLQKKTINYYNKSLKSLKESDKSRAFQDKALHKIRKATEGTETKLGMGYSSLKKTLSSIGSWLMIGFGLIKNLLGGLITKVGSILKFVGKLPFQAIGGIAKFLIRRVPLIAGVLSTFKMIKDAWAGSEKAREWHNVEKGKDVSLSQRTTAVIGATLGGTKSGAEGAKSGALKGAGIGMLVGSVIAPGIGTAIGGAIGAIAGGILGAIGGENIAKGLQYVWDKAKNVISAVVDMITWPFRMLKKLTQKFVEWMKDPEKSALDKVKEVGTMILNFISWPHRMILKAASGVLQFITNHIPGFLKKILPDFILSGLSNSIKTLSSLSEGFDTGSKSITKSAEKGADVSITRSYASGGIVPKPSRPLDGQGGQLAMVHEGEKIIPKSVVESSKLSGIPPNDLRMGSTKPDLIDSIISGLKELVKEGTMNVAGAVGGLFGKLKTGYENVKEGLGPSSGFGWLSRMFESAGAGPAAIGWDRTGGHSYGYYQLAEKTGTIRRFFNAFPSIGKQFVGMNVGSDRFNETWKRLAMSEPSFGLAQHEFIKQNYLNPYLAKIKKDTGFDLSLRSQILQEVANSISVQHGPGSNVISKAIIGLPQTISDEDMIKKIYEYKYTNVGTHFRSSSHQVQNAVANRIQREASIALGSLGTGKGVSPQSLPKAQYGGIISKTGPIYAHQGEIIGPINDVKDSLLKAMLTKKDVAQMQADKDTATASLFNETSKGIQSAVQDSMNNSGKHAAIVMNNMNTMISEV
ncbi:MAG: hypothetical protein WC002_08530, partial [Candidatus Muiribacteriota bacterium]